MAAGFGSIRATVPNTPTACRGWSRPSGMPGNARELRKHVAILEREIAELEQA
jgi:hypothetical protein